MPMVIQLGFFLVIIAVILSVLVPALSRRREGYQSVASSSGPADEVESASAYRNHQNMARWIELQLKDDLIRSSVPAEEQARAKRLLDEFYGDDR